MPGNRPGVRNPRLNPALDGLARIGWCVALVLVFALSISEPSDLQPRINDKLAHFLVFLVLGVWAFFSWRQFAWRLYLTWFLVVYGITIEVTQYFVPGRYFSILDWVMDILGVLAALWLFDLLLKRTNR